eukprot:sb/3475043/
MAGSHLIAEYPISVVSTTPAHCNTCLEPAEGNWTCGSCPVPEMISKNYMANLCYKTVLHCLEDLEYTIEGFKERQRDPYREEDNQNFLRGFDAVAALSVPTAGVDPQYETSIILRSVIPAKIWSEFGEMM